MVQDRAPQMAAELGHQFALAVDVFIRRVRREEVAGVRQAVRADGAHVGQAEGRAEVFAHIAARLAIWQGHAEAHAAGDHGDFLRFQLDQAQFRGNRQPAFLRHDQQFAIGRIEETLHRAVCRVHVDGAAAHRFGAAIAGHRLPAIDEVRWRRAVGQRQRVPAQLVRRSERHGVEIADDARVGQ